MALCFGACSSDDDDDVGSLEFDNYYQAGTSIGFNELKLALPNMERFEEVLDHSYVYLSMVGVDDRQEFTLPVFLEVKSDSLYFEAITYDIQDMPHQHYYLNSVKYPSEKIISKAEATKSTDTEMNYASIGAVVSMDDPNDISITSTFDAVSNMILNYDSSGLSFKIISTVDDLWDMYNVWAGEDWQTKSVESYIQTANINLSEMSTKYGTLYTGAWVPIGGINSNVAAGYVPFNKKYNGNGYAITEMECQYTDDETAFFYSLGDGAVVENLAILDTFITSTAQNSSVAVTTEKDADITISNVMVSGSILGGDNVGGFIAYNNEANVTFTDCLSMINLSPAVTGGVNSYGGFVGNSYCGSLAFYGCSFSGAISDVEAYAGGFLGYGASSNITVHDSSMSGSISAINCSGTILGYQHGGIIDLLDIKIGVFEYENSFLDFSTSVNMTATLTTYINSMYFSGSADDVVVGDVIGRHTSSAYMNHAQYNITSGSDLKIFIKDEYKSSAVINIFDVGSITSNFIYK